MKTKLILLIIATTTFGVKAQDYHVSHYDVASLYLNPALTGFYGTESADYRLYLDQRSQWRAIGVKPFLTSYVAYDKPATYKGRNFGLGGYLINNNGGIGNFNTISLMLSGAYDILNSGVSKKLVTGRPNNKHLLTVGLQMGVFFRSTNPNNLSYDVQYAPSGGTIFDKNIPNNEVYSRENITRFDANYGIYYKLTDRTKKVHPFAGFSISHLTRPKESLTGANDRMPLKWIGHGGCDIKVNEDLDLTPRALYMLQAKAHELNVGLLAYYRISEKGSKIFGGIDYRIKDALIVNLGLKYDSYALRFSYDINTSYLKNYTNGRGAFEVSLIYSGEKGKPIFKQSTLY